MVWPAVIGAVGSVAGGLIAAKGAESAASSQRSAALKAGQQFRPFNIRTPLGRTFTKGRQTSAFLSNRADALMKEQYREATGSLDDRAADLYSRMGALSARGDRLARTKTRQALFRSGRLGTTGGIREIGEIEAALADARLKREMAAYDQAYNFRQGAIQNYLALASAPTSALIPASLNRNPAAAVSAAGMINSGNTMAAADANMYRGIGNAIGGIANNSDFQNWASGAFSSIFNSNPQTYSPAGSSGYGYGAAQSGWTTPGGGWGGI